MGVPTRLDFHGFAARPRLALGAVLSACVPVDTLTHTFRQDADMQGLVTGGVGFIGSPFVDRLRASRHTMVGPDHDVTRQDVNSARAEYLPDLGLWTSI